MSVTSYVSANGMEPMPLSAMTPDAGPQKVPANSPASAAVSGADAASPNGEAVTNSEDDAFSFWDVLDMVNPLQHIPIVSTIYREITGDSIKDVSRVVGGALLGGPIGAAVALVDVGINQTTGKHIDEHMLAMVDGDGSTASTATAAISSGTDNSESAYNMIPPAGTAIPRVGKGRVDVTLPAEQQSQAPQTGATTTAEATFGQAQPLTVPAAKPLTATSLSPEKHAAAHAVQGQEQQADASQAPPQGRRFALNRTRDTRTADVKHIRVESEYPTINKPDLRQSTPTSYRTPAAAPSTSAATAASMPLTLGGETAVNAGAAPDAVPMGNATLPMGVLAPQDGTVPAGSSQPSPDALYKAMQAQGLEPNQHPSFAGTEKTTAAQKASADKTARAQRRKAMSAADSAEMGTAIMPAGMGGGSTPTASAAAASYSQTAATTQPGVQTTATAPATPASTTSAATPTQLPGWYDQAVQKAYSSYQKTGALTGGNATVATNAPTPINTVE
ncbi:hypothetical protein [Insolitispirillum peregrinum]|uniref:Uncharacterized protein n=1 Tax=Insolitispirillum peregrinum TaxID=80876 RepID=A0A1N7JNY9_9PROT|nr:hypothetical protein [Insolitispirillum peregrinum]SIS51062.1 hypothetical protein SAMN05421779_102406 [Insolitispirillum peregrinum]